MPKLSCRCGELIDLSPIPNPLGFSVVGEARVEEIAEALIAARQDPDSFEDAVYRELHTPRGTVHGYECSHCGRWAIFRKASDAQVMLWLRPEPDDDGGDPPRVAPIVHLDPT